MPCTGLRREGEEKSCMDHKTNEDDGVSDPFNSLKEIFEHFGYRRKGKKEDK